MPLIKKLYALLVKVGTLLQSPVLLVIRLYWGWQFVLTGWGKLHHLNDVASFFASLGIPAPKLNAIMAASTETICGSLLFLGLFSRFAGLALTTVMCVALCTDDHAATFGLFGNPDKFFKTDPFLFLYASVVVLAFGAGRISIDALIGTEKKS